MILTLVISSANVWAKPHQDMNPVADKEESHSTDNQVEPIDFNEKNLSVSTPPNAKSRKIKDQHYSYIQSVSPRIGTLIDTGQFGEDFGKAFKMLYGFNYMFPKNRSPQLEVGADLIKDNNGQFHASKRWIINERSSFRAFYKLGGTIAAIGKEGFATFTNFDNYYARATIGLEDYYKDPMSIRLELEIAANFENVFAYLTFGYSWGF